MSAKKDLQPSLRVVGAALTPEQKRFNALIEQVSRARKTLAAWQENIPLFHQMHAQVIQPLHTSLLSTGRAWIFALDGLLSQSDWSRPERKTLKELLCGTASELLEVEDDDPTRALFDKYSDVDFATEKEEDLQIMKQMTEAFTGLDLGDDDIHSDEDLFRRMHEGMEARNADDAQRSAQPQRRKSVKQKKIEAEAQQVTQSVREIYRKLASVLHPDREPDPTLRETKTALMQKVNQAYGANDLLTLLEVQLQIEQVDCTHIATASTQRLKHYNKVLTEQLRELTAEVYQTEAAFCMQFDVGHIGEPTSRKLGKLIDQHARQLRGEIANKNHDLRMLSDKPATKRWLKQLRQTRRQPEFYEDYF